MDAAAIRAAIEQRVKPSQMLIGMLSVGVVIFLGIGIFLRANVPPGERLGNGTGTPSGSAIPDAPPESEPIAVEPASNSASETPAESSGVAEAAQMPLISLVAVVFAVGAVMVGTMLKQVTRGATQPPSPAAQAGDAATFSADDASYYANRFVQSALLGTFIIEGAAIFNVVAYIIEGQIFSPVVAAALLGVMLLAIPTTPKVEAFISEKTGISGFGMGSAYAAG